MTSMTQSGTRRRRVVAAFVAGGTLLTVGGLASSALFTDTAAIDGNEFAFGTVDLSTNPTTNLVSMPTMVPGDSVTAPLTVKNDGSMELRYALSDVVSDNKLGNALTLTIKTADTGGGCAAFSGTQLYTGILGVQTGHKILGDKAVGQDGVVNAPGADRVVGSNAQDNLCVRVVAPATTIDNSFKDAEANVTFTFDAEQTANN